MTPRNRASPPAPSGERRPYRVRLPGFLAEEEVGLGDLIKRATAAAGIRPCGGCARRAASLNRWLVLSGRTGNSGRSGRSSGGGR